MDCDFCERKVQWVIHAVYEIGENILSKYPGALARVCDDHLTIYMAHDNNLPASTKMWIVMPKEEDG